jgi:hypothetical protein
LGIGLALIGLALIGLALIGLALIGLALIGLALIRACRHAENSRRRLPCGSTSGSSPMQ